VLLRHDLCAQQGLLHQKLLLIHLIINTLLLTGQVYIPKTLCLCRDLLVIVACTKNNFFGSTLLNLFISHVPWIGLSSVLGAWRDMCYYWIIWLWKNQSFGRHFQRCFYSILIFIFANFSPIIVYTSLLSHNPTHFANPNFFTQYSNSEAVIYVGWWRVNFIHFDMMYTLLEKGIFVKVDIYESCSVIK
jgi:hypothetical protein